MSLAGVGILITQVRHFVGLPTAREMAAQGARVVCHDESFAEAGARDAFANQHPDFLVSAEQEPVALAADAARLAGRLDVLVNNDAFPAIRAPVAEAALDDMRAGLEAMVVKPFALASAATPLMRQQGHGKIIFVTSATPLRGLPNYSMYVTARGAANAMTVTLAQELARDNIQVNAVAPNYVESESYFPKSLTGDPETLARITRNIPLGRLGKPEEIAALIAFLASDKASFMTGMVVPFAGGWA